MRYEAIIIGAGPIGIETAAAFKQAGINYIHFESGQIGQTFLSWPRNTLFYSSPEWIAIAGIPIHTPEQFRITGEVYLSYLRTVVESLGLDIRTYERVVDIRGRLGDFWVITEKRGRRQEWNCSAVIFATGGLDRPNTLGIPGEDLPHVTHRFDEPHRYFRQKLLIVGGRNSAIEAAVRSWRAGAEVAISYRRPAVLEEYILSRLYLEVSLLIEKDRIAFYPETVPEAIGDEKVTLRRCGSGAEGKTSSMSAPMSGLTFEVTTDFVFIATGFKQDPTLFELAGVQLEGDEQRPAVNPLTMETSIPGIYVAGTAIGGSQRRFKEFITTGHSHPRKIVRALTGETDIVTGNIPGRDFELSPEDIE